MPKWGPFIRPTQALSADVEDLLEVLTARECPRCEGEGTVWSGSELFALVCGLCDGRGYIKARRHETTNHPRRSDGREDAQDSRSAGKEASRGRVPRPERKRAQRPERD